MKNDAYWRKRMQLLEQSLLDTGYDYIRNLEQQYDLAIAEINKKISAWYQRFAKNNGITLAEAKRLLNSDELEEFKWTVQDYIKRGEENALSQEWTKQLENASARVHISRLDSLKIQLRQEAEALHGQQLKETETLLEDIYREGYYHTAFEIQKGLGFGWSMHTLNSDMLKKVLSRPWTADGQTFSDRIWTNKTSLVNTVNTQLTQMIMRGEPPDKAIKTISDRFSVSKRQAGRLVMTESAAFASTAQKDCFTELDVEEYKLIETLDSHTCDTCGALDGKVYKMSDFQVGMTAPPFHPWCRGCTAPHFADMEGLGSRFAQDTKTGKSYSIPNDMTYKEWKAQQDKLYGAGTVDTQRKIVYNESADKAQFESYKSRLGAEAPKTFAEFRKLKYDDPVAYNDLTGFYKYIGHNPDSNRSFYNANQAIKAARENGDIKAKGTVTVAPRGRAIIEINEHAAKRILERDFSKEKAQRIIDNAVFALKQRKGTQYVYYTSEGFAVLDNNGVLGSTGPLNESGKKLYHEVMKHVKDNER